MGQLKSLEPQRIGAVFRPPSSVTIRRAMRRLRGVPLPVRRAARLVIHVVYLPYTAKTKFLLISLAASVTLLGLAEAGGALVSPAGADRQWAWNHHLVDNREPSRISLALFQDPAGLIVLAVVLVTPIFCCQQVRAIADFVSMNERNGAAERLTPRQIVQLDRLVDRTNTWFAALGRRDISGAVAVAMAAGAAGLYAFVNNHGLMQTWNVTALPDPVWRSEVYAGWWANLHTHPELALALCAIGTYAFYFLAKQLAVGVIFAVYLKRSSALGFGVTPNMNFDSDGFSGLRTLRQFMLWTYGSALSHMAGLLVLFTVWLPAAPWMLLAVVGVMVLDMLVIVYPSSIGYHFALAVKQNHVKGLYESARPPAERDAEIAKVWSSPVLPVATRRAMTGITLYLLVPALLSLVPGLYARL
ncbi:hypothetical protein [Streptomyces sp. NPDC049040]|uniref:hypothetical protein n=1 Tax=Streptomyces sp. NPDC049040 TaxID=3365593 RepID=UPI0037176D59